MAFVSGAWKAVCDRCGRPFLNRELRLEHTGLRCCGDCWDPKHPQEFVRAKADKQMPPWVRPEATPTFVTIGPPDWNMGDVPASTGIGGMAIGSTFRVS